MHTTTVSGYGKGTGNTRTTRHNVLAAAGTHLESAVLHIEADSYTRLPSSISVLLCACVEKTGYLCV